MKNIIITAFIFGSAPLVGLGQLVTNTDLNTDITAIYGSGNSDTNWTASTNDDFGIELGLRAKLRFIGPLVPTGNVYTAPVGISSGTAAKWNFDFSITSDTSGDNDTPLTAFTYLLSLDIDPTAGESFISFSPLLYLDNEYGYSDTANGDAPVKGVFDAAADFTVAQNSRNYGWDLPAFGASFDPLANGIYTIRLEAFSPNDSALANPLAQATIQVAAVPEPSTVALLSMGVAGGLLYWRRRRKAISGVQADRS